MFRHKKENPFLKMFENKQEIDQKREDNILLKERLITFFKNYKYQSLQYQVVWAIRIFCWILLCAIAVFGVIVRIKNIF